MVPLISLEEHFFAEGVGQAPVYQEQFKWLPDLLDKLEDLGSLRLRELEKGKISLQVISHGPGLGCAGTQQSVAANNQLAQAVKAHPARFAGFAVLPMGEPQAAAAELRRCVGELGFVGALVDNHANGTFYDDEEFWCIFEAAQELDVPIYLHPTWPDEHTRPRYAGNYSSSAALSLGSSGFGWHIDTGLHVLKLFAAGLFDQYPRLKIIVGHMGETLPFMLERIVQLSSRWGDRRRPFEEVYGENIWITTSGCWSVNPMATILRNTNIEHILYSVDYPFARNEDGLAFMEALEKSGLVSDEEFQMIAYRNAEKLIGVKARN